MKPQLLYIGLEIHRDKTKSDVFFRNILSEYYDLDFCWCHTAYDEDLKILEKIQSHHYDAVVFWQVKPSASYIPFYQHPNMTFVPMIDACINSANSIQDYYLSEKDFACYREKFKILCFSKTLYRLLEPHHYRLFSLQYYPKPQTFIPGKADEVFFWQRTGDIDFLLVKKLFNQSAKIHIHSNEIALPPQNILKENKVTTSAWFDNKQDMIDLMNQKALYIAPRTCEGIGMSFLDAMAYGKAIVAFDFPTMNEYITDGQTGYLFDLDLKPLDLSNLREIQQNGYEALQKGYTQYLVDSQNIIDFVKG